VKKLRALLGLPVLELETGEQIGEVQEVLVDVAGAVVCKMEIISTLLFAGKKQLSFADAHGFGRDAVMISSRTLLQDEPEEVVNNCYRLADLCDKAIFTENGLQLGIVADLIYNEHTGEITAYELSDGFITDWIHGLQVMPLPQTQIITEDRLIVPDCMTKLIHV
jgi:uncharacterized protein YrrD